MPGNAQLIIDIQTSRRHVCLLLITHGLAIYSLSSLRLAIPELFLSVILILLSLGYYIKNMRAVTRVVRVDQGWEMYFSNGVVSTASLLGGTYSSDWLTLLVFRSDESSRITHVLLFSDSITISVFKRLKVILRTSTNQAE